MILERKLTRRDFLGISGGFLGRLLLPPLQEREEVKPPVYWGNRSRPEVALTFDDGFSRQSIETALRILRKNHLACTFFVIGKQLTSYPELWQEALADGHQICNHTYSHAYLDSLSPEGIGEEIKKWDQEAKKVLGEEYFERMRRDFPFIRFPGGAGHKDLTVLETVQKTDYLPIAWSAETYSAVLKKHDYRNEPVVPIAKEVCQYIISSSQNGLIVLLHFNLWDVTELGEMIEGIKQKNLIIKPLGEILN